MNDQIPAMLWQLGSETTKAQADSILFQSHKSKQEKMSAPFSAFDEKTQSLEESLADAKCTLEELNESGDLEERLEASFEVDRCEQNLTRHLLSDPQEDFVTRWPQPDRTDEDGVYPEDES